MVSQKPILTLSLDGPLVRLERTLGRETDFESVASTNSAIGARKLSITNFISHE